ncbi:MAG TPA: GGDEF domain-containing protein [Bacillota bacterium]|nr:GGDEF domain-containing protein [Bacillota bacterium]HOA15266.1 GGDEF domain-containing protein [Bacillota bacterium]
MYTALQVGLNLFSIIVLVIIVMDLKYQDELRSVNQEHYVKFICSLMLVLILEALAWVCDGRAGIANKFFNEWVNAVYFAADVLPTYFWAAYVNYSVYGRTLAAKRLDALLMVPAIINLVLSLASPFNGWMFYVDEANVYHRGEHFYLIVIILAAYILYSTVTVMMNKKHLNRRTYLSLLLFHILPVIGGAMQGFFYGMPSLWSASTLMVLVIHLNIQRNKLGADPLTGISNRRDIDSYIKDRIREAAGSSSFSGIFIDIDNFKSINDTHGHVMGDRALQLTADLLRRSTRKDDFIARYGGDEFLVILPRLDDPSLLEKTVARIREEFDRWNKLGLLPFSLSISVGSQVYDRKSGMNQEQFIRRLDELMYESRHGI